MARNKIILDTARGSATITYRKTPAPQGGVVVFSSCIALKDMIMARSRFKPSATHRGKHKVRKMRKGCLPLEKTTARK